MDRPEGEMMVLEYSRQRYRQLEQRLLGVQREIARAAEDYSGVRTPDSPIPQLIVVTKFFPASDLAALYDLGVRRVGENRDREAAAKVKQLEDYETKTLRWSYIGQLQTNKAKSVVRYASDVQSVDRPSLVKALGKAYRGQVARYENGEASAPRAYRDGGLDCLIQLNLDETAKAGGLRGGADPSDMLALAERIETEEGLRCRGLMAVAPLGADPDRAFEHLHGFAQQLRQQFPQAEKISAGMSTDMAAAIRWGSTTVRVGSQIMGSRSLVD